MSRLSMVRCARRVVLVAGLALAALPAAPALADTTIGQTGSTPGAFCVGPTVTADANYVVPSGGGTITSFSYESVAANAGQQLDLLVLRPTATAGTYTVVGKTGLVTLAGTGLETFTANIPVQEGDILGFWNPGSLDDCGRSAPGTGGLIGTDIDPSGDPAVGATVVMDFANSGFDLNLSANLVTPTPTTIADLIESVEGLDLPSGIENSLLKKLTNAQMNLDADDSAGACDKLASFIAAVQAQSGKKIDADDADALIEQAEAVRDSIPC